MVHIGVWCEGVYSFHSGRVLSVLRMIGYSLAVAVYTPYGTRLISDIMLYAIVGKRVLASVGRALCFRFVDGAIVHCCYCSMRRASYLECCCIYDME